ncbi:MAG: hypothetical protein A3D95_13005 [Betaproteobacteria bacterium RIFCSPHIGHO2_12_FULL_69_13]|nr:MAG: hypothetical protein A3D95_13005 [Betaproteobacteria bacterium RIFCSPHIGHO2_12_FULL_69_13]
MVQGWPSISPASLRSPSRRTLRPLREANVGGCQSSWPVKQASSVRRTGWRTTKPAALSGSLNTRTRTRGAGSALVTPSTGPSATCSVSGWPRGAKRGSVRVPARSG